MLFEFLPLTDVLQRWSDDAKREHYALYVILLATPADGALFPELLRHFRELDVLTGSTALLLAPAVHLTLPNRMPTKEDFMRIFADGLPVNDGWDPEHLAHAAREFTSRQTQETYALLRLLDVPLDTPPCLLFFENPGSLENFVIWRIHGLSAGDVVRDFRSIITTVNEKCQLVLRKELAWLRAAAEELTDPGGDLRRQVCDLEKRVRLLDELLGRHTLAKATFDSLLAARETRAPLEHLLPFWNRLAENLFDEEAFAQVQRHRRRWKGRLGREYIAAVDQMAAIITRGRLWLFAVGEREKKLSLTDAAALVDAERERLHAANQALQAQLDSTRHGIEVRLARLNESQGPLDAIESLDSRRAFRRRLEAAKGYTSLAKLALDIVTCVQRIGLPGIR